MKMTVLATATLAAAIAVGAEIHKASNLDPLDLVTSWEEGVVPGPEDTIVWYVPAYTGKNTIRMGAGQNLDVSRIVVTNSTITLAADEGNMSKLTLGSGGLYYNHEKNTLALGMPIDLACDQTWRIENGDFEIRDTLDLKGHTLRLEHGKYGNTQFIPSTVVSNGTFRFIGGNNLRFKNGAATPEMDYILQGGVLQIQEVGPSVPGAARANNLTIDAVGSVCAAVQVWQKDKKSNLDEKIAGVLKTQLGAGVVLMSPTSSNHQKLTFGSLETGDKGYVLFRGTNLGVNPAVDQLANSANVFFETAPTMIGGILPRAVWGENGGEKIGGLVTYDTTYGVRELAESEYAATITAETKETDNVRLESGDSGAQAVTELPSGTTTVNSLFLDTGTTVKDAGGVKLTAAEGVTDAVLKVKSGLVVARQAKSDVTANDAFEISGITLDLDGGSGLFLSRQDKRSNMTTAAPYYLGAKITNDGGKGVNLGTTYNSGLIYLSGAEQSDYTGPTRVLNGEVRLEKTGDGKAIPENGTLEIYAGTCQNPSRQLPNSANIVIYGGMYLQRGGASNSGNAASEVFNDLTMYGGSASLSTGSGGKGTGSTDLRNAVLWGGTATPSRGHKIRANRFTFGGGQLVINAYNGGLNYETSLTVTNGLEFANTASDAYRPISAGQSTEAKSPGGCIRLTGGVTFAGNETNTNRVELYNVPPSNDGVLSRICMTGSQDFDIGDGAADVDLYTNFVLADSTVADADAGAVVKKGAGTLLLASGGTHSGGTMVEAGRLIADGDLAGDVSVAVGATFRGGDGGETGALAIGGDLVLAAGAKLEVEPGSEMTVAGTLSLDGAEVVLKSGAAVTEDVLVARATQIVGTPTSNLGRFRAKVRNGKTELWLAKDNGLIIFVY